jgi:hypothetical protein
MRSKTSANWSQVTAIWSHIAAKWSYIAAMQNYIAGMSAGDALSAGRDGIPHGARSTAAPFSLPERQR